MIDQQEHADNAQALTTATERILEAYARVNGQASGIERQLHAIEQELEQLKTVGAELEKKLEAEVKLHVQAKESLAMAVAERDESRAECENLRSLVEELRKPPEPEPEPEPEPKTTVAEAVETAKTIKQGKKK